MRERKEGERAKEESERKESERKESEGELINGGDSKRQKECECE